MLHALSVKVKQARRAFENNVFIKEYKGANDESSTKYVEPKLTEVTFCPVNNAVSDAYERDDDLYRNYNNDVFRCLYLGETSDSITPLT